MATRWTERQLDEALAALRADVRTSDEGLDRARESLRDEMEASVPAEGGPPAAEPRRSAIGPPARPRARPRLAGPLLAAAAALAVVAISLVALRLTGGVGQPALPPSPRLDLPSSTQSSARTSPPRTSAQPTTIPWDPGNARPPSITAPVPDAPAVTSLAALASRCSDLPTRPGQYRYVYTWTNGGSSGYNPVLEMWIPYDVSDEWLVRGNTLVDPQVREYRGPYGGGYLPMQGNARAPTPDYYAELPRHPGQLHNRLAGVTSHPEWELLSYSGTVPAPADLRAALLRAFTYDPGIGFIDKAHAGDGRAAVAVWYGSGSASERPTLYLDRSTCDVIGVRETVVRHAVVDAIGQRP